MRLTSSSTAVDELEGVERTDDELWEELELDVEVDVEVDVELEDVVEELKSIPAAVADVLDVELVVDDANAVAVVTASSTDCKARTSSALTLAGKLPGNASKTTLRKKSFTGTMAVKVTADAKPAA